MTKTACGSTPVDTVGSRRPWRAVFGLPLVSLMLSGCGHRRVVTELPERVLAGFVDLEEARVWYLRARMAEERGDMTEAMRAARWVGRMDRVSPWSALRQGQIVARLGHEDEARGLFEEALDRSPGMAQAHFELGVLDLAKGAEEDAAVHLQAACPAVAEACELRQERLQSGRLP